MILKVRGENARYMCPVCDDVHRVVVAGPQAWQWNGDVERPTFSPSVRTFHTNKDGEETVCHVFIRDGQVEILSDSKRFGGQTIPLPPLPQWMLDS